MPLLYKHIYAYMHFYFCVCTQMYIYYISQDIDHNIKDAEKTREGIVGSKNARSI